MLYAHSFPFYRLDNAVWSKRHFLVATVMKQSRSGLGEVSNVRSLALRPIMDGLVIDEEKGSSSTMWIPWLRVVCDVSWILLLIFLTVCWPVVENERNVTGFRVASPCSLYPKLSYRI